MVERKEGVLRCFDVIEVHAHRLIVREPRADLTSMEMCKSRLRRCPSFENLELTRTTTPTDGFTTPTEQTRTRLR